MTRNSSLVMGRMTVTSLINSSYMVLNLKQVILFTYAVLVGLKYHQKNLQAQIMQ